MRSTGRSHSARDPLQYLRLIESYYPTPRARLFALAPFTRYVLRDLRPPLSPATLWHLVRLNVWFHLAYCRYRYPWYGDFAFKVARLLDGAATKILTGTPHPLR